MTSDRSITGVPPADRAASAGVSAVPASIPNAGDWAVIKTWRYSVAQIERVTEQCAWIKQDRDLRATRTWREKLLCWSPDRSLMERTAAQLTSAAGERDRREIAARAWFHKESARITAQAIEARRAETGTGSVHESAVGETDAPKTSGGSHGL
jgi:hypothetical protein